MKGSFSEFLVLTHPLQKACTAPCGINANELKHSLRKQNLYVNIVKEGVFLLFICCRFEIILLTLLLDNSSLKFEIIATQLSSASQRVL